MLLQCHKCSARLSPDSHNSGFTFSDFTFPVSHVPDSHFLTQGRDLDLK